MKTRQKEKLDYSPKTILKLLPHLCWKDVSKPVRRWTKGLPSAAERLDLFVIGEITAAAKAQLAPLSKLLFLNEEQKETKALLELFVEKLDARFLNLSVDCEEVRPRAFAAR